MFMTSLSRTNRQHARSISRTPKLKSATQTNFSEAEITEDAKPPVENEPAETPIYCTFTESFDAKYIISMNFFLPTCFIFVRSNSSERHSREKYLWIFSLTHMIGNSIEGINWSWFVLVHGIRGIRCHIELRHSRRKFDDVCQFSPSHFGESFQVCDKYFRIILSLLFVESFKLSLRITKYFGKRWIVNPLMHFLVVLQYCKKV